MEHRIVVTRRAIPCLLALSLLAAAALPGRAEEIQRKWRVSLAAGGYNSQDNIESNSSNALVILDACLRTSTCDPEVDTLSALYFDPRNDNAAFGKLDIKPETVGTVAVQYALSKIFVVEGSVGFRRGDIGDVEVSAQFLGDGAIDPQVIPFNFQTYRVPVGELTEIPIQVTALARFRPRAKFNPYFGAGVGYSIIGFDADPQFDTLSRQMDASQGQYMRLTNSIGGLAVLLTDNPTKKNLEGATVDARDTFEWHVAGGIEVTLKRKWAVFADLRWIDASRSLRIGFDGRSELGVSVPTFATFTDSPLAVQSYGGVLIGSCKQVTATTPACTSEGLIDAGQVQSVPIEGAPPFTNCDPANGGNPQQPSCVLKFLPIQDGRPDPGIYYATGGDLSYDGFALQFGVRYTFKK